MAPPVTVWARVERGDVVPEETTPETVPTLGSAVKAVNG